jgi:hypothetical protein
LKTKHGSLSSVSVVAAGPGFIAGDGSKALFILQGEAANFDFSQEDRESAHLMYDVTVTCVQRRAAR